MASQTVTIRESRGRVVVYLLGSLALSASFTLFAYADWKDGVTGGTFLATAIVCGFWAMTGAFVYRFIRPLCLVLDRDGFRLTNWRHPIVWSDVEAFRLVYMRYSIWSRTATYHDHAPGIASVGWIARPGVALPLFRKLNSALAGVSGTIPHTMSESAPTLLAALESWRDRNGEARPATVS
jgi:hypothetical protein